MLTLPVAQLGETTSNLGTRSTLNQTVSKGGLPKTTTIMVKVDSIFHKP